MAFKPVTWQPVPLLIGLAGSTGSGKTKSALELATGICGDKRFAFLDTEKGRGRHYVGRYEFDYDQLDPPFTPEAYAEKIREAAAAGCPLLVIDSTSHMWEGIGGLRSDASDAAEQMAAKWNDNPEKYTFSSWNKPKGRLNEFVMLIQQCPIHLIFTFRAKEKLKQVKNAKGRSEIVNTGWKPIIDEALPFEMALMAMFHPEQPGVPHFDYKPKAEYLPDMFGREPQMTRAHGAKLAEWALHGGQKPAAPKAEAKPPAVTLHLAEGKPKHYAKLSDAITDAGTWAWTVTLAKLNRDAVLDMQEAINRAVAKAPEDERVLAARDVMNGIARQVMDLADAEKVEQPEMADA